MTKLYGAPPSGDPFVDRRRSGIGGSDAGAILGISPWSSALAVWEEKRGTAPPFEASERMLWGTRLEGAVLAHYAETTGRKVKRGGRRFMRHPDIPYVVGHPDGLAEDRLVEAKTAAILGPDWGEDGSPDIPAVYFTQVQHYMLLPAIPKVADIPVLVGGREYRHFTVPADKVFQEELLHVEGPFWQSVIDGIPPEPDGSESAGQTLRRMFPRAMPEEVVATPEVTTYAELYQLSKAELAAAVKEVDRYAQLMQRYMGAKERLIGPGFSATWSNREGQVSYKSALEEVRQGLQLAASIGDPHAAAILDGWEERLERWRGKSFRVFDLHRRKGNEE